jgi:hypothetical protein
MISIEKLIPRRLCDITVTSNPGSRCKSIELEHLAGDLGAMILLSYLHDNHVVEIHPDQGGSVSFEHINNFKYRRTKLKSGVIDLLTLAFSRLILDMNPGLCISKSN